MVRHRTIEELNAGLDEIRRSPKDEGVLKMIVRRPAVGTREVLERGALGLVEGLVGDTWQSRSRRRAGDDAAQTDMQLNIINARAIALMAGDEERWPLAGDQLYVDLDLGEANLPPGTQVGIGEAVIEVTAEPHTGCSKFSARFGADATAWVNSTIGRSLHLRGINAKVVSPGAIRVGDRVVVRRGDLPRYNRATT